MMTRDRDRWMSCSVVPTRRSIASGREVNDCRDQESQKKIVTSTQRQISVMNSGWHDTSHKHKQMCLDEK